ncbi:sigma-70 family RNA polymerase sigma factor [Pseudomonas sp. R5(2019)]|uniref:sigma-70 family RNA polymerase sigma factor n=1 Tax=Pseudomonas sp. R5(2019) TaxID=2697566 RepID=UPI0014120678|nr:sigma-70 family RNA polymerase sigma factor [Pseudomonas sp. R5(2019)]NBA96278.1 sigma-70 family RNA polymerase sigma factor [Pseudomonas sp. R5(2019)]
MNRTRRSQTISTVDANQLRTLLTEVSLGNRRSFEALYRSVSGLLYAVAFKCMGRKDMAQEVVQESFVRIWHHASRYDSTVAEPLTWMISITRHLAIDQLRKRREVALDDNPLHELEDHTPGAVEQLTAQREASALNRCLQTLDNAQRTAITTAYFQGLSCSEIAARLHQPLGSVKSWIRRGMERLRRCLEP